MGALTSQTSERDIENAPLRDSKQLAKEALDGLMSGVIKGLEAQAKTRLFQDFLVRGQHLNDFINLYNKSQSIRDEVKRLLYPHPATIYWSPPKIVKSRFFADAGRGINVSIINMSVSTVESVSVTIISCISD